MTNGIACVRQFELDGPSSTGSMAGGMDVDSTCFCFFDLFFSVFVISQ